jgi:hypothetical protein
VALGLVVALGGCVAARAAARPQVLPRADNTLSPFQDDRTFCTRFAQQSVSGQVDNANLRNLGAAAGALTGGGPRRDDQSAGSGRGAAAI